MERFLYGRKKQKNQSFSATKYKFNSHVLPFFKNMDLEDISSKTILEWEDYILSENFFNNQNRSIYYVLSGFFEYCRLFYNFDKSVLTNVGCFKKKYEEKKYDFYNLKEFRIFIKYVDDPVYKQFFNLLFFTGMRPGEAMALKFKDSNNGYITVSKTMNSHGKRDLGTPKTFSSNRDVTIDRVLERDLLALKKGV